MPNSDESATVTDSPFSTEVVDAVLRHMNSDHAADNLLIARAFADVNAESAAMTGLDGTAGKWSYEIGGEQRSVQVPWSAPITERPEIRREVVVLYDAASVRLGLEPRAH